MVCATAGIRTYFAWSTHHMYKPRTKGAAMLKLLFVVKGQWSGSLFYCSCFRRTIQTSNTQASASAVDKLNVGVLLCRTRLWAT